MHQQILLRNNTPRPKKVVAAATGNEEPGAFPTGVRYTILA